MRRPTVTFTTGPPMKLTRIMQSARVTSLIIGEPQRVPTQQLLRQNLKACALQSTRRHMETKINHLIAQTQRLKNLSSFVRLQRGDSHFPHHLQDAFHHTGPVGVYYRTMIKFHGVKQIIVQSVPKNFINEIGVDSIRAKSDQQTMMMHITTFSRLDNDSDSRPFRRPHQMVMHRTTSHQSTDWNSSRTGLSVRQQQSAGSRINRCLCLATNAVQSSDETRLPFVFLESDIECSGLPAFLLHFSYCD